MFAKSSFMAWTIIFASTSAIASAATPALFGSCDSDGECSAIFNRSVSEAQSLCGTKTTSIAWRKGSAAVLLQCAGSDTSEENRNYVVDSNNVIGLNYGRYIKASFLQQNPGAAIPDKFGSTPVCIPADQEKLQASTFVLLDKRPNESGGSYCYDVTYLSFASGTFQLVTNSGRMSPNDKDHFVAHVSGETKQHLQSLIEAFRKWQSEQAK